MRIQVEIKERRNLNCFEIGSRTVLSPVKMDNLTDLFTSLKKYGSLMDESMRKVKCEMDNNHTKSSSFQAISTLRDIEKDVIQLKTNIGDAINEWTESNSTLLTNSFEEMETIRERVSKLQRHLAQNGVSIPDIESEVNKANPTYVSVSIEDKSTDKKCKTPEFSDYMVEVKNRFLNSRQLSSSYHKSSSLNHRNFSLEQNKFSKQSSIEDDPVSIVKKLNFDNCKSTPEVFRNFGIVTTPGVFKENSVTNTIEKRNAYCHSWLRKMQKYNQLDDITESSMKENIKQDTPEEPILHSMQKNTLEKLTQKTAFDPNEDLPPTPDLTIPKWRH